jgi:hypothetical protein
MWLWNPLIAEMIKLKSLIFDWCSPLRHTKSHWVHNHFAWNSYRYFWQPVYLFNVYSCAFKRIEASEFLRHHDSHHRSDTWGRCIMCWCFQLVCYGIPIHVHILNISTRYLDLSFSGLFSLIPITYLKQFSNSWPFAAGLSTELYSSLYGLMLHDSWHSSGLRPCTDRLSHDSYDISDLNFVSKFCLHFRLCFLM